MTLDPPVPDDGTEAMTNAIARRGTISTLRPFLRPRPRIRNQEGLGPCGASASWTSIGPEGGSVAAVVRNPKKTSELYAVNKGYPGHVFRSANGGGGRSLDKSPASLVHYYRSSIWRLDP
jgi:hypothetical protein